ncbi:MAG: hypothetical protein COT85_02235 [Chlamydiae bacterium CG10_big_fil_rev_8_21_14_0_10_42_34]|nr:MAG: hypothetical protein COT85_02235 [Chlamydiae bacterium CG10_big_fil_rev_8_21_14_0_10_42_34]
MKRLGKRACLIWVHNDTQWELIGEPMGKHLEVCDKAFCTKKALKMILRTLRTIFFPDLIIGQLSF